MRSTDWFDTVAFFIFVSAVPIMLAAIPVAAIITAQPVQAAQPAPPVVKECQPVNTAKVNDALIITVMRCQPENGEPYLINSAGFMMPEE